MSLRAADPAAFDALTPIVREELADYYARAYLARARRADHDATAVPVRRYDGQGRLVSEALPVGPHRRIEPGDRIGAWVVRPCVDCRRPRRMLASTVGRVRCHPCAQIHRATPRPDADEPS